MSQLTQKIMVGLSGGVDSSVSALLLKQQGFDVEALFMKNWEEDDHNGCNAKEDLADAQSIADKLNIKLHTINFASEYWDDVFQDFIKQHKKGLTPNPDVLCNQRIKFTIFLEHALDLGADKIATGHYAGITQNGTYQLKTAQDKNKDQSYFLHLLTQYQLSKALFPLATIDKKHVRQIAQENNLITADKKDSTGICFIGKRHFQSFLADYIPEKQGRMLNKEGKFIKHHPGVWFYTIGQRKGLGIGGGHSGQNEPWFVADKNTVNNELIVVQGEDEMLYHQQALSHKIHWISDKEPHLPLHCHAKIRYRQTQQPCRLDKNSNGIYIAHFNDKQRAITPGQSIVFYDNDICLGGGIINERL